MVTMYKSVWYFPKFYYGFAQISQFAMETSLESSLPHFDLNFRLPSFATADNTDDIWYVQKRVSGRGT